MHSTPETPPLDLATFLRARYTEARAVEMGKRAVAPSAFVLADLDSKLAIVDEFAPEPREPETDAELHARFAHPAWEYETTEGPRKQWDYSDEPPYGDNGQPDPTWERNADAGRDGWERFDYTEESYWRRLRAEPLVEQTTEPYVLRLLSTPFADHLDYKVGWRP